MKVKLYIHSILAAAMLLNIGCMSTVSNSMSSAYNNAKRKIGGADKSQDALYSQVSDQDKQRVNELQHQLQVTEQKHVLAKLEKQRDRLQRERSDVNEDLLEVLTKEQNYRVRLARLEAIDKNNLGDKVTNIETIADTHVDALETQQKRLKLQADVSVLDVKIEQLQEQIDQQKIKVSNLESETLTSK